MSNIRREGNVKVHLKFKVCNVFRFIYEKSRVVLKPTRVVVRTRDQQVASHDTEPSGANQISELNKVGWLLPVAPLRLVRKQLKMWTSNPGRERCTILGLKSGEL